MDPIHKLRPLVEITLAKLADDRGTHQDHLSVGVLRAIEDLARAAYLAGERSKQSGIFDTEKTPTKHYVFRKRPGR